MSDRILNATAVATWVLAFCVMAFAVIFVLISKVSADSLGECPTVFTTQDICVITTTETSIAPRTKDHDPPEERYVPTPYHVNGKLHIRPVDGCGNHVDGRKTNCHEPIVFTVNMIEYCIQDNQAHGDQLCVPEAPQQQEHQGSPQTQDEPQPQNEPTPQVEAEEAEEEPIPPYVRTAPRGSAAETIERLRHTNYVLTQHIFKLMRQISELKALLLGQ